MSPAGIVTVRLGCSRAPCAGTVALVTARRVQVSRRARVRLGRKSYSLRPGLRGAIRIRLSRRNRRLVRRLRRVRVRVTVTATGGTGTTRIATLRVKRRKR
jgi:hypothetical protein